MDINPKNKDANLSQQAIDFLPEIGTFLGSIASIDNHNCTNVNRSTSLTKLADQAEKLKYKTGYGY